MFGAMDEPRRWRTAIFGVLLALVSCGPLDLTGKSCSATRPCPTGWECLSSTCRVPGTGNRVVNGGFESAVAGWTASHGSLTVTMPGRTTPSAALWAPDGTALSVLTLVTPPVESPQDGTWCAWAWIQTGDQAAVGLQLLQGGDAIGEIAGSASGVWTRLDTSGSAFSSAPISVALTSSPDAGARVLHVDDVAVWHAPPMESCALGP